MRLLFKKTSQDMTNKEIWLWNWYEKEGYKLGYKGYFNYLTKEYSLYYEKV